MATTTIAPSTVLSGGIRYDKTAGAGFDILTDATLTSSGSSGYYKVPGARQVDLLIAATGTASGTSPTLQFDVAVSLVNTYDPELPTFIADITKYNGSSITTAPNVDGIIIVNQLIGDFIRVDWTLGGTSPSFSGVFARLVFKK